MRHADRVGRVAQRRDRAGDVVPPPESSTLTEVRRSSGRLAERQRDHRWRAAQGRARGRVGRLQQRMRGGARRRRQGDGERRDDEEQRPRWQAGACRPATERSSRRAALPACAPAATSQSAMAAMTSPAPPSRAPIRSARSAAAERRRRGCLRVGDRAGRRRRRLERVDPAVDPIQPRADLGERRLLGRELEVAPAPRRRRTSRRPRSSRGRSPCRGSCPVKWKRVVARRGRDDLGAVLAGRAEALFDVERRRQAQARAVLARRRDDDADRVRGDVGDRLLGRVVDEELRRRWAGRRARARPTSR